MFGGCAQLASLATSRIGELVVFRAVLQGALGPSAASRLSVQRSVWYACGAVLVPGCGGPGPPGCRFPGVLPAWSLSLPWVVFWWLWLFWLVELA